MSAIVTVTIDLRHPRWWPTYARGIVDAIRESGCAWDPRAWVLGAWAFVRIVWPWGRP